jgi:hypothetical protein
MVRPVVSTHCTGDHFLFFLAFDRFAADGAARLGPAVDVVDVVVAFFDPDDPGDVLVFVPLLLEDEALEALTPLAASDGLGSPISFIWAKNPLDFSAGAEDFVDDLSLSRPVVARGPSSSRYIVRVISAC